MTVDAKKPGVVVYFDLRPALRRLSDEEKGRLFDAILSYGETGEEQELDGAVAIAFDFVKPRIDADADAYSRKVERRQAAANARWANAKNANAHFALQTMPTSTTTTTSNTDTTELKEKESEEKKAAKPPRASRFTPPSLNEVREYCKERGNAVNAEQFCDFYSAKGWRIGNQTMKDWRAAVRTWERREQAGRKPENDPHRIRNYDNDTDFLDLIEEEKNNV